ncbi:S1/P1 nuclease [Sinorhizobium terangae]|uniref:S1/P1 nuclease n=1 Tax=Sinorhizobium terangae TaxID=110322 RepID=UPI0024B04489|nr:S1/P1 nuclease [Sinorhizobium terangae]WFU49112.1 S1/P1 nuclease [Sinorhizobium terangae]
MTVFINAALLVIAFLCSGATTAFAWGDEGHEIVCRIAYMELSTAARQRVDGLIAQDGEFREFAKSCTWPDHPRQRASEHFLNVERSKTSVAASQPCGPASKCVVTAIVNDARDLASAREGSDALRLLKSLGHWVGDIHQPMHVSFQDDKGGNKVYVTGPCDNNMHSVWDSCIIEETIGRDAQAVAIDLRSEIKQQERTEWTSEDVTLDTVLGWANESLAVSRASDVGYCILKGDVCQYDENRVTYDGGQTRSVMVDEAYLQKQSERVSVRLKMAGIRLGGMLEKIFGDGDRVAAAANMRDFSLTRIIEARSPPLTPNALPQLTNLTRTTVLPDLQTPVAGTQQQIDMLIARLKKLEAEVAALKSR